MKNVYIAILLTVVVHHGYSQRARQRMPLLNRPNRQDVFLEKQWWLGFSAGPNTSQVTTTKAYSVVSPTNYSLDEIAKQYKPFYHLGSQVTFAITFAYRGWSASLAPSYQTNRFTYSNEYEWHDSEVSANRLELKYENDQKVSYLQLPLIIRYEYGLGKFTPYLQLGCYTSFLLDGTKSVVISGTDYASGGVNQFENEPIIVGAKDLFARHHWGITAGGGAFYKLGNVRLNVEAAYNRGMTNISSTKNRYASDRLTGVGDSFDDMTLTTISLSVGCLFPLRFLGSGFKAIRD